MKTIKIGDFIQISEYVKLYIEDIEIEIDNNEITLLFMCSELDTLKKVGSEVRPFLQSQIEYLIKRYYNENNKSN